MNQNWERRHPCRRAARLIRNVAGKDAGAPSIQTGSWSQLTSKTWRCLLSLNLPKDLGRTKRFSSLVPPLINTNSSHGWSVMEYFLKRAGVLWKDFKTFAVGLTDGIRQAGAALAEKQRTPRY